MRSLTLIVALVWAFAPIASAADSANDDKSAREIVRRAIEAQGGEEQVAKFLKPWRAQVKGTAGPQTITGEILHAGDQRGRISTTISLAGLPVKVVVVQNDDGVWRSIAGVTTEVKGKELEEMLDGGYRSRKVRFLLPILKEPGYELSLLPDAEVSDRPASGIRVKNKGHRDVDLYFDKENGRLVKTESRILGPDKKQIVLEQVFSNYRDFDGVLLASKFTKYENGKLRSVEEFADITFVDAIDPKELAKP
jgi:hypothetical protein